jgi:hypothetical protein
MGVPDEPGIRYVAVNSPALLVVTVFSLAPSRESTTSSPEIWVKLYPLTVIVLPTGPYSGVSSIAGRPVCSKSAEASTPGAAPD